MPDINPYKAFISSQTPNWLMCREEVSASAKLIYSRLCQYAGVEGRCIPFISTLAKEVGLKPRTTQRFLAELKEHKLIRSVQLGPKAPNQYFFLEHEWQNESRGDKSDTPRGDKSDTPIKKRINKKRIPLKDPLKKFRSHRRELTQREIDRIEQEKVNTLIAARAFKVKK